jgi:hypothetical protein
MTNKRFFLAGIIQGSFQNDGVHDQCYRDRIKAILKQAFPESFIYCPVENHPDSITYSDQEAHRVFHHHLDLVRKSDVLIVYLPEASMGSAIEMWEAHHAGVPVISITPMTANWVVRLFSTAICETLDDFKAFVTQGKLNNLIRNFR